jgi:hypothetical protein
MSRALLLLLALGPSVAFAQVVLTLTTTEGDRATNNCDEVRRVTWTASGFACSSLTLWATPDSSCGDNPKDTDLTYPSVDANTINSLGLDPASRTGTFDVSVGELPAFQGDGGTTCGPGVEKTHRICGAYDYSTTGGDCTFSKLRTTASNPPVIPFDGVAPQNVNIETVTVKDRGVTVRVGGEGASQFFVELRPQDTGDFTRRATVNAEVGVATIDGLENGVTYEIRANASDLAGNESLYSPVVTATPVLTRGFWGQLNDAGTGEQGGCNASGGMLATIAAMIAAWTLARRSSR